MSGALKSQWRTTKVTPLWPSCSGINGAHVLELSPCSRCVEIRFQHRLATLCQKEGNLGQHKSFSMLQCLLINLCAKHFNGLVAFGFT